MITRTSPSLTLAIGLALGAPGVALALDMASYLALTPGNWAIYQDNGSGSQSGYVTSQDGGQVVKTYYQFESGSWVFDSADLLKVTDKKITYLGTRDATDTWLFDPPVILPRKMQVDDSIVYKGVLRNQTSGARMPVTLAMSVTADKLGVTVPAGNFNGCIKMRTYNYGGGGSRDSVSIDCPHRPEMKTWVNKIEDTGVPTDEDRTGGHSSVGVQAGESNPPIP